MSSDQSPPTVARFSTFEADLVTGELRKSGVRVKLEQQPFQVLRVLLQRQGELVTRDDLREAIWSGDTFVDFDHSLSTAILKIREALGDSAESPRDVETLPRRGYRFVAPAAARTPPPVYTPSGIVREVLPDVVEAALESHRAKSRWRTAAAILAVLSLAAVALLVVHFWFGD